MHDLLKLVPTVPTDNTLAFIKIKACRLPGAKSLSEPIMAQFTDANIGHYVLMSYQHDKKRIRSKSRLNQSGGHLEFWWLDWSKYKNDARNDFSMPKCVGSLLLHSFRYQFVFKLNFQYGHRRPFWILASHIFRRHFREGANSFLNTPKSSNQVSNLTMLSMVTAPPDCTQLYWLCRIGWTLSFKDKYFKYFSHLRHIYIYIYICIYGKWNTRCTSIPLPLYGVSSPVII